MLGFSTGGMTWLSMFNLHNVLQTTSTLLECFDSVFFSVFTCMCMIGSKRVLFEEGLGVLPQNSF